VNLQPLILTSEKDFTADLVVEELWSISCPFVRYDLSYFPRRSSGSFAISNRQDIEAKLRFFGGEIDMSTIGVVWYRRPSLFDFPEDMSPAEKRFAVAEARHFVGGALRALNCEWINHPDNVTAASYKLPQLRMARDLGFRIPRTLVTSDKSELEAFFRECGGRVIYKTLGLPTIPYSDYHSSIYTTLLSPENIEQFDKFRIAPCLFQEYVDKKVELRVTVISDQAFCAEIDSQTSVDGTIDWRAGGLGLPHSRHALPNKVAYRCIEITKSLHLHYGAIDLILTPEDEYVFLEINPSGEWGWIQHKVDLPIARYMASFLSSFCTDELENT
jgi:glutathione synthase/RimK-type ligase-like ATP-grasp enzyme